MTHRFAREDPAAKQEIRAAFSTGPEQKIVQVNAVGQSLCYPLGRTNYVMQLQNKSRP